MYKYNFTNTKKLAQFIKEAYVCVQKYDHKLLIECVKKYLANTYTDEFTLVDIDIIESLKEEIYNYLQSESYNNTGIKLLLDEISRHVIYPKLISKLIIKSRLKNEYSTYDTLGNLYNLPLDILFKIEQLV